MLTKLVACAALWGICACGPSWVSYKPAKAETHAEPDKVYTAAIRVMMEEGITIADRDKEARILVTDWDEREQMGSKYRYKWTVSISDTGTVTVATKCKTWMEDPLGPDKWKNCGSKRHSDKVAKGKKLAASIAAAVK